MMRISPTQSTPAHLERTLARRGGGARLLWLIAMVALAGCAGAPSLRRTVTPAYRPDNIFKLADVLAKDLRRVAVLPVSSGANGSDLADGREAVEPVLLAELIKTKRFEVIPVAPHFLRSRMGRVHWSAADTLPAEFLPALRDTYGCDAVLFVELTEYRAYAPVAIGWRLKLVDARTGFALWAGDELFDSRKAEVLAAARRFQAAAPEISGESSVDWTVSHSPRRLAQYSAAQLFDTLPLR